MQSLLFQLRTESSWCKEVGDGLCRYCEKSQELVNDALGVAYPVSLLAFSLNFLLWKGECRNSVNLPPECRLFEQIVSLREYQLQWSA